MGYPECLPFKVRNSFPLVIQVICFIAICFVAKKKKKIQDTEKYISG